MGINRNPGEDKSVIGLDSVYVAQLSEDSSTAYAAGTPEILAPAAELSMKPVASQETQYADNQPFEVFSSQAETDMELTLTGVPSEMLAKLTGGVFDPTTGTVDDNAGVPGYFAVGFRSLKSNGKYRYFWLQKVQFSPPEEGATTKADKATPKTIKLVAKAIKTTHKWTLHDGSVDGVKRRYGDEDTDNFSATGWFSQVQVPGSVVPSALALSTSDPADGASGVAVDKTITLTFNNKLQASAINNVVLSEADGTLVACTNSLDTTGKIMTVNPDSSLGAATVHILAIGVVDIYGQDLQAVVNFTTA
jgi:phi13 family phage major tail protein